MLYNQNESQQYYAIAVILFFTLAKNNITCDWFPRKLAHPTRCMNLDWLPDLYLRLVISDRTTSIFYFIEFDFELPDSQMKRFASIVFVSTRPRFFSILILILKDFIS